MARNNKRRGVFGFSRQHLWLALILFILLAAATGAIQLSFSPQYASRSTVFVGQDQPLGLPEAASILMSSDEIEDHLAVLESDLVTQHMIDELNLQCRLLPSWEPNPFLYQVSRVFSVLFKTASPLDYATLSYPQISLLEYEYSSVDGSKLEIRVNGTEYTLNSKGRELDRKQVGEPLVSAGIRIAAHGFTPDVEQAWKLSFPDPATILPETKLGMSIFRVGRRSSTVGVKFTAEHPELASSAVNSIISFYLTRDIENTQQTSREQLKYVNQEIGRTEQEAESQRLEMREILQNRDALLATTGTPAVPSSYLGLQSQYSGLTADRAQIRAVLDQMEDDKSYAGYLSSQLNPRLVEPSLVEEIIQLQSTLDRELSSKTEVHPVVIELQDQIDTKLDDLKNLLNENYNQLGIQSRSVQSELGQFTKIMDLSPETTTQLNRLESAITLSVQSLGNLLVQKQLLGIRMLSDVSPLVVLDAAQPNTKPVSPRIVRAAINALIFSLIITIALLLVMRVLDPALRDAIDLTNRFKQPVVTTLFEDGSAGNDLEMQRLRAVIRRLHLDRGCTRIAVAIAVGPPVAVTICGTLCNHKPTINGEIPNMKFVAAPGDGLAALLSDTAAECDCILLAVTPGTKRLAQLSELLDQLEGTSVDIAGFILLSGDPAKRTTDQPADVS